MRLATFSSSIALACGLALSAGARADDVTFTGFAHGAETVDFALGAPNGNASGAVWAGGFATLDGAASFVSYCVDLYQFIGFGELYPEYGAPSQGHVFANTRAYADLGRLYSIAGVVDSSVKEAAFQIAVWEIAYETSPGPYSLGVGAASFSGGTAQSSGALDLASSWLAGLGDGPGRSVSVIESALHQDMVYAPVPEPSTYVLMIAGLVASAEISRRRRRRA